nr:unnamed protein product [Callosobruchus chinensis]
MIPPLSKPARCIRGTSSSHPKAVVLHTSRTKRYDRTFVPRVSWAWNELPGDVLVEPASVGLVKCRVNKLPLRLRLGKVRYPYLSSRGTLIFRPAFALCSVIKKIANDRWFI